MESTAPALQRGLAVLRHLERAGACTLDQLSRSLDIPKASLLRLLQTLIGDGAVVRDDASKRYRAVLRLVAMPGLTTNLRSMAAPVLGHLAEETGCTSEWHEWDGKALVLSDRADPEDAVVTVQARIGFKRDLRELDALTQVCRAFAKLRRKQHHAWQGGDDLEPVAADTMNQLDAAVVQAQWAQDLATNGHGVFRTAAPVLDHHHQLVAVLAIARSNGDARVDGPVVLEHAQRLSRNLGNSNA